MSGADFLLNKTVLKIMTSGDPQREIRQLMELKEEPARRYVKTLGPDWLQRVVFRMYELRERELKDGPT